jgi:hypothetical protein
MYRPSDKAMVIAEEMIDYVHPGMSRGAAVREIAGMIDEMNADLMEAVHALTCEVRRCAGGPCGALLYQVEEMARQYQPLCDRSDDQHELFAAGPGTTTTVTAALMP